MGGEVSCALVVRVQDMARFDDLMQCAVNMVTAKKLLDSSAEESHTLRTVSPFTMTIDAHVSFNGNGASARDFKRLVKDRLFEPFQGLIHHHRMTISTKAGSDDTWSLLDFIEISYLNRKRYDLVLKLSSKSAQGWDEYTTQTLCGTPSHIISIVSQFQTNPALQLVAPQGSLHAASVRRLGLHPLLPFQKLGNNTVDALANMYTVIFGSGLGKQRTPIISAGGSTFWVRYQALHPKRLTAAHRTLKALSGDLNQGDSFQDVFERLVPTWIAKHGGVLAEMIPAPKALPLYFPQFHAIPENDHFHSAGFTEWTLLKPLADYEGLMKPLPEARGGLDYYDLLDRDVRLKQAELAALGGVHGFVYYHYWFSGARAPPRHLVMHRVLELMLQDGQPDRPFMLSWANEPWTRTWAGGDGDVLLGQEYGDRADWTEHFYYLLKFFDHPRYIRVNDKPAFALYRIGHFGEKLKPILRLWSALAKQNGLRGIHFVTTLGNFVARDVQTYDLWKACPEIEAAFHFRPQLRDPFPEETDTASVRDLALPVPTTQYWGAYSSFDPRPRRPAAHPARNDLTPALFQSQLMESFAAMTASTARFVSPNLYFVTAWNEWNEQAVLEPDEKNGFGYLLALKTALESIQVREFIF